MGYKFFGSPYIPPIGNPPLGDWAFVLGSEERQKKFKEIPDGTDIVITHSPPKNIFDESKLWVPNNLGLLKNFGCEFLREELLTRVKPMYNIFGHNHDGYGQTEIEGVKFINAATCNEMHQPDNAPVYFELPIRETD